MSSSFSLHQLGWRPHFSRQLSLQELERFTPARIASVQRSAVTLWSELGEFHVLAATLHDMSVAVGDWVVADLTSNRIVRLLERSTLLSRLAAGKEQREQRIAANLDTLFIVTSCNEDFNASRLERYLALAHDARIDPVIVMTKRDLCEEIDSLQDELRTIAPTVPAIAVNATDRADAENLLRWLSPSATVAFVGSSGVGKSTLVNTLTGSTQVIGAIREDDSKGRHTTTSRQMIAMPGGAWLIDTPGMRELKVGAVEQGIRAAFDDVETLAQQCKFRDCSHGGEVGCAVLAAIAAGELAHRRLANYLKLQRESLRATQSVFERREASRRFGKMHKVLQEQHRRDRGKQ
jgi:ribosome biogenesis GTPase / thiamine phosphate phosphatase